MSQVAERPKRGGHSARPLTSAELAQAAEAKALLKAALEGRWPLRDRWGHSVWTVLRSRSQDGATLRISIIWEDGPTAEEVIALAESLDWPAGLPLTLCLRRRPEINHRKPLLHHMHR